ncbi:LysR family transcriptional regulator [Nitratireductor soli]|uniref:LysR family transcriptional regulator n=1 Tax=Nitratireductor soli TaxID=1670619 RepID=UPI00065DC417|nr:LysR family transcriptional regulator [Nitratireductor soli]
MEIRPLGYFVAVYEERNLSLAARRVGVSQPSISAAMQALESALGCPLLIRHAKGVTPTAAGEQLYPLAIKLLGDAEAIHRVVREHRPLEPLRLSLTRFLPLERAVALVREFSRASGGYDVILAGEDEEADLRVVTHSTLRDDEIFFPLWRDTYLLGLPRSHPLTLRSALALDDLQGLPWLKRTGCEVEAQLEAALEQCGVAPAVKARISSDESAIALLDAGLGSCLLPRHAIVGPQSQLCELAGMTLERNVGIAHARNYPLTDSLLQALEQCRRLWQSGG